MIEDEELASLRLLLRLRLHLWVPAVRDADVERIEVWRGVHEAHVMLMLDSRKKRRT